PVCFRIKFRLAVCRAEIERLPIALRGAGGAGGVDGHAANGVDVLHRGLLLQQCRRSDPAGLTVAYKSEKTAVNISTASHRFCRRRFSSWECWLLSWLAMGKPMTGVPAGCWKRYIGTLPPRVGRRTGSCPAAVSVAAILRESGRS